MIKNLIRECLNSVLIGLLIGSDVSLIRFSDEGLTFICLWVILTRTGMDINYLLLFISVVLFYFFFI